MHEANTTQTLRVRVLRGSVVGLDGETAETSAETTLTRDDAESLERLGQVEIVSDYKRDLRPFWMKR